MIDFVKLIHLAAAIFWMGGMAFMLLALRPAAAALLQQPERLMMGAVWKRFFPIVLVSIVTLFATGTNLYTTAFRAIKAAAQVHLFMLTNFVLGWLAIAAVRLVR